MILLGAAIGDVSGSSYEFDGITKPSKEKAILFPQGSYFTDDTVMTCAICDSLKNNETENPFIYLKKWVFRYPNAGYGISFRNLVMYGVTPKFDSYGNGAAMRISPVAYFAKDEKDCIQLARNMTMCTHPHPEGVKGAITVAVLIYRALHGYSKRELHSYALSQYDFESLNYDGMRSYVGHGAETCQVTVPQALWCFFHSESFEDCLRTAISIGWDCDTLAAIACSIAEAYYGEIPSNIVDEAKGFLPLDITKALTIK